MPREFHLSPPGKGGVSCDADGVFVAAIPILNRLQKNGRDEWQPRDCEELSEEIGEHYGLPIDMSSKAGGLRTIANALNAGNVARAQIATVLLGIPDPPPLSKRDRTPDRMIELIRDLHWSGLLKWDPDEHPRWPAGSADSIGGRFAPKGEGDDADGSSASRFDAVDSNTTGRDPRTQLADAGMSGASDNPVFEAARRAAANRGGGTARTSVVVTSADMTNFGPLHVKEAQQLAAKLGHGATTAEFLALSSVESEWGKSPATVEAFNFFGVHNSEKGPYPGQTGTYVTSGEQGIPGHMENRWLPPNKSKNPVQNVAAFPPESGYMDSGNVVVTTLLTPKALAESGASYSDPAAFFATVHKNGWAEGPQNDYVGTMLQRMKHFEP